jgi:primosomal protein N' (replication factor Y)
MGSGTEALEDELQLLLKNSRVLRLDRDQVTSQTRLEETLDDFRSLKANVMIGTQMVVKGHDFPMVTLVVVILADALLKWPDFRAAERAYQTLLQVSGRSGRAERPGVVMIQGYDLNHPVLQVINGTIPVDDFISQEVEMRKELLYPPFSRFVRFRFDSTDAGVLKNKSENIMDQLRLNLKGDAPDRVLGPSESTLFKVKGSYRYDAYFKAKTIEELVRISQGIKTLARTEGLSVVVDVDPYSS